MSVTAIFPGTEAKIGIGRRFRSSVRHKLLGLAEPARNLARMPLSVTGIASVVTGVFLVSLIAGLIVLGITLVALEHVIADEL